VAQEYAENPVETAQAGAGNREKYLIFALRDRYYAIPSRLINEVAVFEKAFPLPLLPSYVRGIINRYSVPYALIDIGFLLLGEPSGDSKLVVLKEEVDRLAFLIDDVTDIADILPEDLLKVEQEESADSGLAVSALVGASFEWKGSQILCLEVGELIRQIKKELEV
jgi:purine-binding chemotaxis protein CheW